jgi:hypothetical protein
MVPLYGLVPHFRSTVCSHAWYDFPSITSGTGYQANQRFHSNKMKRGAREILWANKFMFSCASIKAPGQRSLRSPGHHRTRNASLRVASKQKCDRNHRLSQSQEPVIFGTKNQEERMVTGTETFAF